jgi:glycine/D-amino acid oxidase-like deaminating enzyme
LTRFDVVVIGAGVLGAAAAYHLARLGRPPLVLEARAPGSGASGNSFAWVNAVRKEPDAYYRLNAEGVRAYADLAARLGAGIGFRDGGSLEWAESPDEQASIRARVERLGRRGYGVRLIPREAALALEPHLAIPAGLEVAFYEPDGWVDVPSLIGAFLNAAAGYGSELRPATTVRGLARDRGIRIVTDSGEIRADEVLVCAGADTADLLAPLGFRFPVRRVPGLLAVTSAPPVALTRVVHAPGVHLRPDPTGGLMLGAEDLDGLATESGSLPSMHVAAPLLERARGVFPAARDVKLVAVKVGVRPMPADGVSIVGPVSDLRNLWVAVTHSAVTVGPLLGRLVAEEMTGGPASPLLEPFRPDRFRR